MKRTRLLCVLANALSVTIFVDQAETLNCHVMLSQTKLKIPFFGIKKTYLPNVFVKITQKRKQYVVEYSGFKESLDIVVFRVNLKPILGKKIPFLERLVAILKTIYLNGK